MAEDTAHSNQVTYFTNLGHVITNQMVMKSSVSFQSCFRKETSGRDCSGLACCSQTVVELMLLFGR